MHPDHTFLSRGGEHSGLCSFIEADFYSIPGFLLGDYLCDRPAAYTVSIFAPEDLPIPDVNEADLCVEHTAHVRACSTCSHPAAIRTFRAPA
jgi:hypothetical protein